MDGTSLSYVHLENVNFSSGSIPVEQTKWILHNWNLVCLFGLSMPANVKRMGVIHKIINSVYDDEAGI